MIPASRIAVIDDEQEAVEAIRVSLERMGTSCLPILVDAGRPSITSPVRGIRLLFLDIHLMKGITEGAALYEANAAILEQVIAPDNGPYVLVVWTTDKEQRNALLSYISEHHKAIPRPLASLLMAKEDYLEQDGSFSMPKVQKGIADLLQDQKEATALLYWENAVDLASGDLLGTLSSFVPRDEMFLGRGGPKIKRLLGAIAQAAVGVQNVSEHELPAINEGLMPLLSDRLAHLPDADGSLREKWRAALANLDEIKLDKTESAKLNSMYHVDQYATVGQRGAVYELPDNYDLSNLMPGQVKDYLYPNYFVPALLVEENLAAIKLVTKWRLIGLRAACDQAQPKPCNHRFLLAAQVTGDLPKGVQAQGAAIYMTPFSMQDTNGGLFKLIVNFHFLITLTEGKLAALALVPKWRVREGLCTELENKFSSHAARPGIISLR